MERASLPRGKGEPARRRASVPRAAARARRLCTRRGPLAARHRDACSVRDARRRLVSQRIEGNVTIIQAMLTGDDEAGRRLMLEKRYLLPARADELHRVINTVVPQLRAGRARATEDDADAATLPGLEYGVTKAECRQALLECGAESADQYWLGAQTSQVSGTPVSDRGVSPRRLTATSPPCIVHVLLDIFCPPRIGCRAYVQLNSEGEARGSKGSPRMRAGARHPASCHVPAAWRISLMLHSAFCHSGRMR